MNLKWKHLAMKGQNPRKNKRKRKSHVFDANSEQKTHNDKEG